MDEIEEIKKRIDIVDFIGSYIPLKKAGRNFRANCPFHQEKSPSFIVSADRQIWHCFGSCHEGGDAITFFMKWESISFAEALRELARQTGVQLHKHEAGDDTANKRERMYAINQLAAKYYHYVLMQTKQGARAKEYLLKTRGVHEKVAETYEIGYSPDSWDSLKTFLMKKGYGEDELETVGLISRSKSGRTFDRFRARLMFPILDTRGNHIGFSGRIIEGVAEGHETAKYVNTQETPIYHKRESLFGIFQAKDAIKKEGWALLVEGEFDVILPHQHDVNNVVAVKGSAITNEQLQLIRRYASKLVFAMDADASGVDAIKRGLNEAEALDMEVAVVQLSGGKDPDEAVRTDTIAFKKALAHPLAVYDFLFEQLLLENESSGAYGKKHVIDGIVEHLNGIQNPIIQSHYVRLFSKRLEVDEDSIKRAMRMAYTKKKKRTFGASAKPTLVEASTRDQIVQRSLLSMVIQKRMDMDGLTLVFEQLQPECFENGAYQKLFAYLRTHQAELIPESDVDITQGMPAELLGLYNELYLLGSYDDGVLHEHQTRMIYECKLMWLRRELSSVSKQVLSEDVEDAKTNSTYLDLKRQLSEVEKTISSL